MSNHIDSIAILGGILKKNKSGWHTTSFNEGNDFEGVGDRLRVIAGRYLYDKVIKNNSDIFIIVSGGRGRLKSIKGVPTVAEVIKKELIELGVPSESIMQEDDSGNTFEQLLFFREDYS